MSGMRTIHGGLEIIPLPQIRPMETDYCLIFNRFSTEKVPNHLAEQANEVIDSLMQKEPQSMEVYSRKQKSYNRLLMLWEQMAEVQNKTGPHTVRMVADGYQQQQRGDDGGNRRNRESGKGSVYEVQLSIDFCERNCVQSASIIVLEPYDRPVNNFNDGYNRREFLEPFKGRVLRFDAESQTIHFFALNRRRIPAGNYYIRFDPSPFVYNARDHIMSELLRFQNLYSFLVFPTPLEDRMTKEQYITLRDEKVVAKMKLSNEKYNKEQKDAIAAIVFAELFKIRNQKDNLLPFILHGPPGTGKTTTLVEACRLIEETDERAKILVCTPSNTAADLFAHELLQIGVDPAAIFRLNALMHPITELREDLREIALIFPNPENIEQFGIPPFNQLKQFRIIICTLLSSTYLAMGGMRMQFSHIIIDEAGQASELDTLVPIVGLIAPRTKLVLAGDPRQLGPVETLEFFRRNGITNSLIERYESNANYKDDPRVMTMLRKNYRSHSAIIEVPSRLFYNNELHVPPDADRRDALAGWTALPKKDFPLFWHHVNTPEQKEVDGHSYMNKGELEVIIGYIQRICTELYVKPEYIGVVCPYSCQARKLRHMLDTKYSDVTVDTVERFQGSQRRVIIVSTVRSNEKEQIGFMMSNKRFCTTCTRAEELMIIVGNSKVMAKDPSWKEMLNFCRENGATVDMPEEGAEPKEKAEEETEVEEEESAEEENEEESAEEEEGETTEEEEDESSSTTTSSSEEESEEESSEEEEKTEDESSASSQRRSKVEEDEEGEDEVQEEEEEHEEEAEAETDDVEDEQEEQVEATN